MPARVVCRTRPAKPMPNNRFTVIPEVHSAADPAAAGIRVPFVRPALPPWEAFGPAAAEILAGGRLT